MAKRKAGGALVEMKDGTTLEIGHVMPDELLSNTVLPDEYDADPGEAPSAETASERTRDYLQGVREGSLRVIEFVESDFGDVGRVAAGEARKRWALG
jgi:hypothetical protein